MPKKLGILQGTLVGHLKSVMLKDPFTVPLQEYLVELNLPINWIMTQLGTKCGYQSQNQVTNKGNIPKWHHQTN